MGVGPMNLVITNDALYQLSYTSTHTLRNVPIIANRFRQCNPFFGFLSGIRNFYPNCANPVPQNPERTAYARDMKRGSVLSCVKRFFSRPYRFAACFGAALALFSAFVLLDTFVFVRREATAEPITASLAANTPDPTAVPQAAVTPVPTPTPTPAPIRTDTMYRDGSISVELSTVHTARADCHIADVRIGTAELLRTAFAEDTFGRNVRETVSEIAGRADAILAVNGDFYGANAKGYVIRNGVLYRDTVRNDSKNRDLAVLSDGSFLLFNEKEVSARTLLANGAVQVFAFGPALVENGTVAVQKGEGARQHTVKNPRTAIGIIEPLHYVFLTADGRTQESPGLTVYELAEVMAGLGCETAYNLDGGGSTAMVFLGSCVNRPTTDGKKIGERRVSDIVFIG